MKIREHFQTITYHRKLVREGCFKVGLYWQGLTHDLSKFSPTEFLVGAKYFQGDRSPNNAEKAKNAAPMIIEKNIALPRILQLPPKTHGNYC